DPLIIELFEITKNTADAEGLNFFVVGASARDLILEYGYKLKTKRATMDIDLGVQVADWGQYQTLKQGLIDTAKFEQDRQEQRLKFKKILLVDIIPFGDIAGPEYSFTWPSKDGNEMNTLGFSESFEFAILARLRNSPVLEIKVTSLAGLAIMKIIAWHDNPARGRDAQDLSLILHNYLYAGNEERIFDEENDIFDKIKKDQGDYHKNAGARLLGRDMAKIALPESKKKIIEILEEEAKDKGRYRLVEGMIDSYYKSGHAFEDNIELLQQVKLGILDC
ncbi:MAG: nucleotidyl transferase AbiEii/AbiGii toxin family protein, partial [Deltaproteobacteria bacterium]|nr:nucleotidyl transferase AbiEii/AbiGii toxin family protein [Deltaproteobacteria bacterium]